MTVRRASPLRRLREHEWTPPERAVLIAVISIVLGCLFVTSYSLALGDPVPHKIDAGLIGDPAGHPRTVNAVQGVVSDKLAFRRYASATAAVHAIHEQRVYTALDLSSARPTLYVASAAGASVARLLEKSVAVEPSLRVVDVQPLAAKDPNGLDVFYRMLVATIIGFITVIQVRGQAGPLLLRHHIAVVLGLAVTASFALTLVGRGLLDGSASVDLEQWGILALHVLAVASFASLMAVLLGRWAILPTWLFFVILGNASSGGAVSPPLLPTPFALISQWLPSGATVTALRDAIYFGDYQHAQPIEVLAIWAIVLFTAWVFFARRREAQSTGVR